MESEAPVEVTRPVKPEVSEPAAPAPSLGADDYRRLLDFRDGVRRFLHWSEERARSVGLTPAQHQLLLAVRGHRPLPDPSSGAGDRGPTIGDLAAHLLLRHHSAVELVGRAAAAGFVTRSVDPHDHRVIRVRLTRLGNRKLAALSAQHLDELRRLAPSLQPIWAGLGGPADAAATSSRG